jgi:hypothetical protein
LCPVERARKNPRINGSGEKNGENVDETVAFSPGWV